jgi:hypothetical protein
MAHTESVVGQACYELRAIHMGELAEGLESEMRQIASERDALKAALACIRDHPSQRSVDIPLYAKHVLEITEP